MPREDAVLILREEVILPGLIREFLRMLATTVRQLSPDTLLPVLVPFRFYRITWHSFGRKPGTRARSAFYGPTATISLYSLASVAQGMWLNFFRYGKAYAVGGQLQI